MAEAAVKIVYWKGLLARGELVAQVCRLAGVSFENVDATPEDIPKLSEGVDFWNLPLLIKGEHKISETAAIIQGLCLYHKPELLGKTIPQQIETTMLYGVASDIVQAVLMPCFTDSYSTVIPEKLKTVVAKKLGYIEKHLGSKTTLVGDYYTIADTVLVVALEYVRAIDAKLGVSAYDYSKFDKYVAAYKELPEIKAHYESEDRKARGLLPPNSKLQL